MVNLTIDGRPAQVPEGTTILEAARQADIHIPHLCYLKGINEIAACRVCCVEVEGERAMVTACNNPVQEGMAVHTNSPRARSTRRINVELILSQHDCKCATCVRSGNCQLQEIANDLGILELPFEIQLPQGLRKAWTTTFPLFHDYNKCIKCMRCIQVCDKIQSLSIWDVAGTGSRTTIDVSNNRVIKDSDCALCGQCITHCPTGGLRERDDTQRAFAALADPDKITVVQVAPAVRTAWGEAFGLPREQATMGRMAAALRRLGFRYIFDTNFTADLTIMEEGSEFVEHLARREEYPWPLFTSCCRLSCYPCPQTVYRYKRPATDSKSWKALFVQQAIDRRPAYAECGGGFRHRHCKFLFAHFSSFIPPYLPYTPLHAPPCSRQSCRSSARYDPAARWAVLGAACGKRCCL